MESVGYLPHIEPSSFVIRDVDSPVAKLYVHAGNEATNNLTGNISLVTQGRTSYLGGSSGTRNNYK